MLASSLDWMSESLKRRHFLWLAMLAGLALLFYQLLERVAKLSLSVDHYSHLLVVPFLTGFLLYWHRREIFAHTALAPGGGGLVAVLALPAIIFSPDSIGGADSYLFVRGLALFILVLATFIFCYGVQAFRSAAFPLFFLFLAVPLPAGLVQQVIVFLQKGSAVACDLLFSMTGVPFLRRGDIFYLPNLTIEVAPQCSGIRSSIGLLITTLLAIHFFLKSWWKKALVIASLVPVVLLKNGLRIVTLSLLSIYVDRGFLSGWLHTSGGIVFYLLALAIVAVLLRLLRADIGTGERAHTARVPS